MHTTIHRIANLEDLSLEVTDARLHEYTRHTFPFTDMPVLQSHVHPHFAIFSTGQKLDKDDKALLFLTRRQSPYKAQVERLMEIYAAWMLTKSWEVPGFPTVLQSEAHRQTYPDAKVPIVSVEEDPSQKRWVPGRPQTRSATAKR